jgi:hypothetical protein
MSILVSNYISHLKLILTYSLFILLFSEPLFGQNVFNSESATASANLIVPISISATVGSLDFGEIILTGSPFISSIHPTNGKYFVINGHPGRGVTIIFNSIQLSNVNWVSTFGGSTGSLDFTPDVRLENGTQVLNGNSYILNLVSGTGELVLNVGGAIDIEADQPHGFYEGLFTITVSY